MREVRRELSEPNGINPQHLLVANIPLKSRQYQKPEAQTAFLQQVTEKLRNLPGVESADASLGVPLGGSWNTPFNIVGQPPLPESKWPWVDYLVVGPAYRASRVSK